MAGEGELPKAAVGSSQKQNQLSFGSFKQPEFGQTSPLQNRLQNRLDSNVFNIPKPNKARPEHHGAVPGSSHPQQARDPMDKIFNLPQNFVNPKSGPRPPDNQDVVEIPRPANPPNLLSRPPAPYSFSSFRPIVGGFSAVNHPTNASNFVDLTKPQEPFNLDAALLDDRFGAADPYTYVDAGKATENIKALLEGAFEDDEDKPRTRGRKKKMEAKVDGMAEKLESLGIGTRPKEEDHSDGEEDEDDGSVEGLSVKLLPHQVDGVKWMKDKEIGVKKKNGILPKGGILADDVRFPSELKIG